jgi:hypothetical protein
MHRAGIQLIIHHDMPELVIELLGDNLRRPGAALVRMPDFAVGLGSENWAV